MGVSRAPGATAGTLARVPKTRRSKRAVEKRAPKLIENPKAAMMIRGTNTSAVINELLCDLYVMKKPFAKHFSRKNDIRPFEDATSIEFFGNKNDASLFAFGSHNKKRPHNLVLGRLFDYQMLDMCELGITGYRGLSAFPGARKPHLGARPCMIFEGADFELVDDLSKLRSLLLDFFRGWPAEKVNLRGIDHAIVCTAVSNTVVCLRTYEIRLLKAAPGTDPKMARVKLVAMGPCFDMAIRRTQWAPEEMASAALRRPKHAGYKPKSIKNVRPDGMGDQIGRLHLDSQDLSKMALRRFKSLKGAKVDAGHVANSPAGDGSS